MSTEPSGTHISPLDFPTRTHHAEINGCQVISATAMPDNVMHALAVLVDNMAASFRSRDDAEREADAELSRRPCQVHYGQYADYCGPCRSERIGAR